MNFHTKLNSSVSYCYTDGTKSDNTELLAVDLITGVLLLLLLSLSGDLCISGILSQPVNTAYDISGSKQHTCYNQLFYTVCISSGSIKYHNSVLSILIYGDVVNSGTCSGYCKKVLTRL